MKPKIALVAHGIHDRGGMERASAELLRRAHKDYSFTVVAAYLAPALRPLVSRWIQVRVPMKPIPLKYLVFWLRAGRVVRGLDVDLIHTLGAVVPNRVDLATIHFCHAGFVAANRHLTPTNAPLLRRINGSIMRVLALAGERWCYRPSRLRAFAAVSPGVRAELLEHYAGIDVQLTPNGVDLDRFKPDPDARAHLRGSAPVDKALIAVFVGSDWYWKGLPIAMRAVARVRSRGIDLRLWVIGKGNEPRFVALARELAIQEEVSFLGSRPDPERFFAAADIFVLPSLYETFSLVGFEAAASGLPVVVTPVHGIGDLITQTGAGIVARRDPVSFAAALLRLSSDEGLRRALGRAGLRASRSYSWEASVTAVMRVYGSLLRASSPSATVDRQF